MLFPNASPLINSVRGRWRFGPAEYPSKGRASSALPILLKKAGKRGEGGGEGGKEDKCPKEQILLDQHTSQSLFFGTRADLTGCDSDATMPFEQLPEKGGERE